MHDRGDRPTDRPTRGHIGAELLQTFTLHVAFDNEQRRVNTSHIYVLHDGDSEFLINWGWNVYHVLLGGRKKLVQAKYPNWVIIECCRQLH